MIVKAIRYKLKENGYAIRESHIHLHCADSE